jgi:DNA invertase Pin-like site-specific DNA recombinase
MAATEHNLSALRGDSPWLFLYLRKSRAKEEAADPDVLKRHRSALLRRAADDGLTIPEKQQFEEVGSGERLQSRPAFLALLAALRAIPEGAGGILYVMDADRLSRGILSERGEVQDLLLSRGILIRTPSELIDLAQPAQNLLYEIKGSLARHELLLYKQRVQRARAELTREGRLLTGHPGYGYDWDYRRKKPVPNQQFPVLQALCLEGLHLSTYALSRKYGLAPETIYYILRNPQVCGWPAKRWQVAADGTQRLLPREEWTWPEQPGDYEAAITRAEWESLQVALESRRHERSPSGQTDGWCRDVVRFVGYEELRPQLGVWSYPGRRVLVYQVTPKGKPRLYIDRELVHQAAEAAILAVLERPGLLRYATRELDLGQKKEKGQKGGNDTETLRRQAAELRAQLAALLRRELVADEEDGRAIRQVREDIKGELRGVEAALEARQHLAVTEAATRTLLNTVAAFSPAERPLLWEELDNGERRVLVRGVIECIPVLVGGREGKHFKREILPVVLHPSLR